jgi:prophage DNA circulation protein
VTWRDFLRPGSWRGVPFLFVDHEAGGGRRGELHEFPERDEPWFEDLGAKAATIKLNAVVLGPNYMRERDALQAACGAPGPGTLIHPTLGMRTLVCQNYTFTESTGQGGAAFFSLEFCEPGAIIPPDLGAATGDRVAALADQVRSSAPAALAQDFSVAHWPAWVEQGGLRLVQRLTDSTIEAGLLLGGNGSVLRIFEVAQRYLPRRVLDLIRAPRALADAVLDLVGAVAGLSGAPLRRISALKAIAANVRAAPAVIGDTPARAAERANQAAFQRLVTTAVAAELVDEAASIDFASYDDAVALREELADLLDGWTVAYADAGDDDAAVQLDALRLAMVRDITARGGSLERIYAYTPFHTEPALVIAHRLYGPSDDLLAQAAEICARNHVVHPLFAPGGAALQVLTND